jgi:hypothetical protein
MTSLQNVGPGRKGKSGCLRRDEVKAMQLRELKEGIENPDRSARSGAADVSVGLA